MLTLLASARLLHQPQVLHQRRPQQQRQPRPLQPRQTLRLWQYHLAKSTCPGPTIRTTKRALRWNARGVASRSGKLRLWAQMSPRMPTPDSTRQLYIAIEFVLTTLEAIRPIRILRVPRQRQRQLQLQLQRLPLALHRRRRPHQRQLQLQPVSFSAIREVDLM
jgi:hypothetical protein